MIILGICHFIPDKAFFFSSLVLNLLCLKSDSSHKVQHDVRVNFFLSSIGWQDVNFSLGSLVGFFRKVIFLSPYSPPPPAKLKNISFWSSCHRAQQYNKGRGTGVDLGGFFFFGIVERSINDHWSMKDLHSGINKSSLFLFGYFLSKMN